MKNTVASGEALERRLARLSSDPHEAQRKYEQLLLKLELFFENQRLDPGLAGEVIQRLAQCEPRATLGALAYGIARNVGREAWRDVIQTREAEVEAETNFRFVRHEAAVRLFPWLAPPAPSNLRRQKWKCLAELPDDERRFMYEYCLTGRRWDKRRREVLAERMGITLRALRKKVHAIRAKLSECVRRRRSEE